MLAKIEVKYEVRDDGIYRVETGTYMWDENDPEPSKLVNEKLIITSNALKEAYEKYIMNDERMNKTHELRRQGFRRKRKADSRAWYNN